MRFSSPDIVWCLRCERTYRRKEARLVPTVGGGKTKVCAYSDCYGSAMYDAWPWSTVRRIMPEYPESPETEEKYPMVRS